MSGASVVSVMIKPRSVSNIRSRQFAVDFDKNRGLRAVQFHAARQSGDLCLFPFLAWTITPVPRINAVTRGWLAINFGSTTPALAGLQSTSGAAVHNSPRNAVLSSSAQHVIGKRVNGEIFIRRGLQGRRRRPPLLGVHPSLAQFAEFPHISVPLRLRAVLSSHKSRVDCNRRRFQNFRISFVSAIRGSNHGIGSCFIFGYRYRWGREGISMGCLHVCLASNRIPSACLSNSRAVRIADHSATLGASAIACAQSAPFAVGIQKRARSAVALSVKSHHARPSS